MSSLLALFEEVYSLVEAGSTVEEAVATTTSGTLLEQDQEYLIDESKKFIKNHDPFAAHDPDIDDDNDKKRKREDDNFITPEKKHVTEAKISPEDPIIKTTSFQNLPSEEDMTEANPKRRINSGQPILPTSDPRNAQSETEVTPIPLYASLATPWPDVVQAIMPFYRYSTTGSVTTGTSGSISIATLRLNSPYDCWMDTNLVYTTDATPVASAPSADTAEATINAAMWYNYYKQYYNYYTVVQADVTVRFRCTTGTKKGELAVYRFIHGRETPKYYESGGSTIIAHQYKRLHPNMSYKFMKSNPEVTEATAAGYKFEPIQDNWIEFSDIIKPGDVHHEVVEDELLEVWSLFDKVPATPEFMTFHIQKSPRSADVAMTFDAEYDIKYYVQFKDLKNSYRYITSGQDGPTLTDMAMQDD